MNEGKKLTKEERILARRNKVAAKRNKNDPANRVKGSDEEGQEVEISESKKQITISRQVIDDIHHVSMQKVTDVRVNRDLQEAERRRQHEISREERLNELENSAIESAQLNQVIESQWSIIAQKDIPQELYQDIAVQYKLASDMLNTKDVIITNLQNELKQKDEDYVELLARHQDDIEQLIIRMQQQFSELLLKCQQELSQIEWVSIEERTRLIQQCKDEIDALFKKRLDLEMSILYTKQARDDEFQKELSNIRLTDAEDYNNLKVTLENNIQLLEQQLEEMRATYQLNSEKLEYNHAVLEERDSENKQTVEHHRQRVRRLQESLSSHKQRFMKQDAKYSQENHALTEAYKRVTEQFNDLQGKFSHFEQVERLKYQDIWAMNEERLLEKCRKIIKADELIHEQILGLKFIPPHAPNGTMYSIDNITCAQVFNYLSNGEEALASAESDTAAAAEGGLAVDMAKTGTLQVKGKYSNVQIKSVMALLSGETGFLLDARLKETMRGLSEEEAEMYKVDAILSLLGVEDREDLDELVGYFFESDPKADRPTVHPNDILTLVRQFVDARQSSQDAGQEATKSATATDDKAKRKKERERQFWIRLGEALPRETKSVWNALESGLRKYNTLLEERAKYIDETTEIARQNEELKVLLQEYLGAKINSELHIPPTHLIRVDD